MSERKPRIKFVAEDPLVRRVGEVRVVDLGCENHVVIAKLLHTQTDWTTVDPGAYHASLLIAGEDVFDEEVTLKPGSAEVVSLHIFNTGAIHVWVENQTPRPAPLE